MTAGSARNALVIGVERLTDCVDRDRPVDRDHLRRRRRRGRGRSGRHPGRGRHRPGGLGQRRRPGRHHPHRGPRAFLWQEGQAVYRWATTKLARSRSEACARAGVAVTDIDVFAPHQANLRIIESMAKLGAPDVRVARDIVESGNTSSASVPLALARMLERGEGRPATPVLLLGYGAGLTYAGQVVLLPVDPRPDRPSNPTRRGTTRGERGDPDRSGRDPGGGRRRAAGRRHPGEVVHRRPRRRLAVDGRDRHGRRGQVRRRDPRRRARQPQDRRRRHQLHREEPGRA